MSNIRYVFRSTVRQLYNEGVFDRVLLPYRIIVKLLKLKGKWQI